DLRQRSQRGAFPDAGREDFSRNTVKIDNGTGGSRETSTGGSGSRPGRSAVDERGRESINFFAELKRRNVYKVAIAYVVGGWALSQGIAQVFPVFDIPNWTIRLIVLLIILGLPVALVLAWMFELTPEGLKRTETADAMPATARKKKHVWIYVVVIGAIEPAKGFIVIIERDEDACDLLAGDITPVRFVDQLLQHALCFSDPTEPGISDRQPCVRLMRPLLRLQVQGER